MDDLKDESFDDDIKVILIGEMATGKTSLINTSIGLEFKHKIKSTQSSTIMQKKVIIDDKTYIINLWDTIGQEVFRSLTKIFMKDAKIVIFVYDITRLDTFNQIVEFWYDNAKEVLGDEPIMGIVGNKEDLYLESKVSDNIVQEFIKDKDIQFQLTSAKVPKNFNDFLELLIRKYIQKYGKIKNDIVSIKLGKDKKNNKKKRWC
jgi:small GTP-binding protein